MTHTIDTSPEAIAALLDGVAPGPWEEITPSDGIWPPRVFSGRSIISMVDNSDMLHLEKVANARFIAAARELVPALAAEIARLTDERDEARAALAARDAAMRNEGRRQVKVKPLEWEAGERDQRRADSVVGEFCVTFFGGRWFYKGEPRDGVLAAQAAAQADYDARILAALEPEGGE